MTTKLIRYLKSQGISIPAILLNKNLLKSNKNEDSTFFFYKKEYNTLISSYITFDLLNFVKKEIVPSVYKYYKSNSDYTKKLFLQTDLINFSNLFVANNVCKSNFRNVVYELYADKTDFIANLKRGEELLLIDIDNYENKTIEGQAIYITELDQTFIILSSNYSYWSLLSFVHELGHAYYNFMYKTKKIDIKSRINSELYAYNAELKYILKQKDKKIKQLYLFFYLSQIILYAYGLQITKNRITDVAITDRLLNDLVIEYMPWEEENISKAWTFEQDKTDNLYYFIAKILALYLNISNIPNDIIGFKKSINVKKIFKEMNWIRYEQI